MIVVFVAVKGGRNYKILNKYSRETLKETVKIEIILLVSHFFLGGFTVTWRWWLYPHVKRDTLQLYQPHVNEFG